MVRRAGAKLLFFDRDPNVLPGRFVVLGRIRSDGNSGSSVEALPDDYLTTPDVDIRTRREPLAKLGTLRSGNLDRGGLILRRIAVKGGLARLDGEGILRLLDYKVRRLLAGVRGLGRNRNLIFAGILRRSGNLYLIILGRNPRTSGVIHLNSRSQLLTRVSRRRYLYCANSLSSR